MMDSNKFIYLLLLIALSGLNFIKALKCKVRDGPSEIEMKRVARSCIKKLSNDQDNTSQSSDEQSNNERSAFDRKDQHKNDHHYDLGGRVRYQNLNKRSTWDRNRQSQNENRYESYRNSNNTQNQYLQAGGGNYNNGIIGNRKSSHDKLCTIHCFFEELNMLNKQDFPDKHKVIYVITRDIRDNELREFYTDAIQECFRFLEMEQRMDKCQFSKSLINCMAEYARANCDDWYNHTMIFGS